MLKPHLKLVNLIALDNKIKKYGICKDDTFFSLLTFRVILNASMKTYEAVEKTRSPRKKKKNSLWSVDI